jgi:hypothetical protein
VVCTCDQNKFFRPGGCFIYQPAVIAEPYKIIIGAMHKKQTGINVFYHLQVVILSCCKPSFGNIRELAEAKGASAIRRKGFIILAAR